MSFIKMIASVFGFDEEKPKPKEDEDIEAVVGEEE